MKTAFFLLTTLLTLSYAQTNIAWITEKAKGMKNKRIGIDDAIIKNSKDPFIYPKKVAAPLVKNGKEMKKAPVKKRVELVLLATINGMVKLKESLGKVGKWYKEGAELYGYKIDSVRADSVNLTYKRTKKIYKLRISSMGNKIDIGVD